MCTLELIKRFSLLSLRIGIKSYQLSLQVAMTTLGCEINYMGFLLQTTILQRSHNINTVLNLLFSTYSPLTNCNSNFDRTVFRCDGLHKRP